MRPSLTEDVGEAARRIDFVWRDMGIDFEPGGRVDLQREGVEKFVRPFDQLLETLERKLQAVDARALAA